jgi:hypothetical protein
VFASRSWAVHGRRTGLDHYAERTAQYAFSPASTRRFDQLDQYQTQWEKLEGCERGVLGVERSRRNLSREKPGLEQEDQKRQERGGPGLSRCLSQRRLMRSGVMSRYRGDP